MIRGYHSFSNWKPRKLEEENIIDNYTFGFELEVEERRDSLISCSEMAKVINEEFNHESDPLFIMEYDGSVDNGFEIITQPMTWGWFKKHILVFRKLFDLLNENEYRSHDGEQCGLHVHIGHSGLSLNMETREIFKNNSQKKIIEMVEENLAFTVSNMNLIMERFQDEIIKFSRRTRRQLENYCQFITEDEITNSFTKDRKKNITEYTKEVVKRKQSDRRYRALNLTNRHTVEIRIFRGTLKWETFFTTMNFVNNLVLLSNKESMVVTFENLAINNLKETEREKAIAYCESRNIEFDNKKVCVTAQLNKNIKKIKTTLKISELYDEVMIDDTEEV